MVRERRRPDTASDGANGRALWRIPAQMAQAFRFVWSAGHRELGLILALEVVAGLAVAAQLLLGRAVFSSLLETEGAGLAFGRVVPQLVGLGVATLLVGFTAAALLEGQRVLAELVAQRTAESLIDVTTQVELEAFEVPDFYDRLERSKANAGQRTYELASGVIAFGAGATGLAALTGVLVSIGLPFLPLVVLAYVPLWISTARNGRSSYEFTFWATPADRERNYLQEVLTGRAEAKEVRIFGLAPTFRRRYSRLYDRRIAELRRVAKRRLRRSLVANLASTIVTLGAAAVLIDMASRGRISPTDAAVAVIATVQLGTRLRFLGNGVGSVSECSLFLSDFFAFLTLRESWVRPAQGGQFPSTFECIAAESVSFSYPGTDRQVLRDVSLRVGRGEMVALVGRNGSGKTTLAKILCGLYAPSSGRVLWNGTDTESLPSDDVRRSTAAIFQDFVCYQLSARDNIGVGDPGRLDDLAGIRVAARDAGIDDVLDQLPDGYATVLSRAFVGGAELSIGQWQRVALARAFLRDAPLLVLDEPAAALDAEAENELFGYIRHLRQGRAALVISHRMSTVREADRIYVLDGGAVVEEGTHDELISTGGHYAALFNLQASGYAAGAKKQ